MSEFEQARKRILGLKDQEGEREQQLIDKEKGAINGGFYPKQKGDNNTVHFVISVDDIEKHTEIVKKAGGKIKGKPMDIEGVGKFVMFTDTEGNRVGMLQPPKGK